MRQPEGPGKIKIHKLATRQTSKRAPSFFLPLFPPCSSTYSIPHFVQSTPTTTTTNKIQTQAKPRRRRRCSRSPADPSGRPSSPPPASFSSPPGSPPTPRLRRPTPPRRPPRRPRQPPPPLCRRPWRWRRRRPRGQAKREPACAVDFRGGGVRLEGLGGYRALG